MEEAQAVQSRLPFHSVASVWGGAPSLGFAEGFLEEEAWKLQGQGCHCSAPVTLAWTTPTRGPQFPKPACVSLGSPEK